MGTSYMSMGLTTVIGSALIGSLMAVTNLHKRNEKMRYAERLRKRSYRGYLKYVEEKIKEHVNYTENILRNEFPAFNELVNITQAPCQSDSITCLCGYPDGSITIRLGVGNIKYSLPIKSENDFALTEDVLRNEMSELISQNSCLRRIPICVDLHKGDRLSVISDKLSDLYSVVLMLISRICLSYSPEKVKVGFDLRDALFSKCFDVLKFMPHLVDLDDPETMDNMADDEYLIIFTDRAAIEKSFATAHNNINHGEVTGGAVLGVIQIVMGVNDTNKLLHITGSAAFLVESGENRKTLQLDQVSQDEFELIVRTLSRLKTYGGENDINGIPKNVPIMKTLSCRDEKELYDDMQDNILDDVDIVNFWNMDTAIYSLSIPLGVGSNQKIICLNPHEKGDGPHGLIAGMTGSGKSEMLMSLVLSLAVRYPPWYVSFFLIDYKGGGMASMMDKLPHVIGSISNLSGSDIGRAFLSIRSENERREKLFIENGVNNILKYQERYRDGKCSEPLPHIFIIIDEFAQLKLEEPDFMQDMIAMSRVGRSLGMHLILCTQKPSGSVDGQIISNSGFQIALKLQDPMDSKEVIRRPDAAYLNNPGRAILRCGNDERIETFQCAYSLSPIEIRRKKVVVKADEYGRPQEELFLRKNHTSPVTALEYLSEKLFEVSKNFGVSLRPLWLEELPKILSTDTVLALNGTLLEVPIGIWDDPANVSRGVLNLNVDEGNVLVCGMPYSGKSTLLVTFLGNYLNCSELIKRRIIIFDWGGGKLSKFKNCSDVFIYLTEGDEKEALEVLVNPNDYFAKEEGKKGTLIIIDGIGNLIEQAGFSILGPIKDMLRKSENMEIIFLVTAYGINAKEVSRSMQGYFKQVLALRQQDAYQYCEVLSKPHFKGRCDLPPGRGYVPHCGRIVEFMTAMG